MDYAALDIVYTSEYYNKNVIIYERSKKHMNIEIWEESPGKSPVGRAIQELDNLSKARLLKKLKYIEENTEQSLRKVGLLGKVAGAANKVHELRIGLVNKICRIYCIQLMGMWYLLHLVIKKSPKLFVRDIKLAEIRADKLFKNKSNEN